MKDPDFDLVRRCQSRKASERARAFEEIFDGYRDRVFNLAVRLLGSESDAEDATQEAFVTVYRKIDEFRFSSRFFTWLYRIVFNQCTDLRRRTTQAFGAKGVGGQDGGGQLETIRDPTVGPLPELSEREDQNRMVEKALARLSDPLRAVIVLRYIEGLQYGEIADVLGCSIGTVKSRLSRAHRFLTEIMGPRGP